MLTRSVLGGLFTLLFLFTLQLVLVKAARKRAAEGRGGRTIKVMDLIITSEDERYSLSRLQMYLWTAFVVIAYVMVFLYNFVMPDIPESLYILMGVNLAASVASTAIALREDVPTKAGVPDFVKDIFLESNNSLDLPRTQMFVWTVVSLLVFTVVSARGFVDETPTMPEIPMGLIVLMGLSQGAYLGMKAATGKKE